MDRLTAPYNFVPLNRTVVLPEWSDKVSMDVPFDGALSGSIRLAIRAETPLMLGGETRKPADGVDEASRKSQASLFDQDVLPGTSIKGCLRSVLEIATFGKIAPRMDDQRLSVRDLRNPHLYTQHFTEMFRPKSRAGWLTLERGTGDWMLQPCDYSVVRQRELERIHAERTGRDTLKLGDGRITADEKYRRWGRTSKTIPFDPDTWRERDDWAKRRILSRADNVGTGSVDGIVVLTGQPQRRDQPNGKALEFLFHSNQGAPIRLPSRLREDFEAVHRDPNTRKPAGNWDYWRQRLYEGEPVPVFWLPDDGPKAGDGIRAMGLAMTFRLAYRQSTRDLATSASEAHVDDRPDFAETLFGYVREGKDDAADQALRGRVTVDPADLTTRVRAERPRKEILLGPKPSFYPAYVAPRHLDQTKTGPVVRDGSYYSDGKDRPFKAYTTYMEDDAELRGWKRYPATSDLRQAPKPVIKGKVPEKLGRKVYTEFTPHAVGTAFTTTIHLHNLRPVELGALLWVITFGGREKTHRHMMGMGKPLGYGCVALSIEYDGTDLEDIDGNSWAGNACGAVFEKCRADFETYMAKACPGWSDSPQIQTLLAMADPAIGDAKATAGDLKGIDGPETFQDAKKVGLVLPPYVADAPGWPAQAEPPEAIRDLTQGSHSGPSTQSLTPTTRVGQKARLDDDIVIVVSDDGSEWSVRLPDNSIEPVKPDELDFDV